MTELEHFRVQKDAFFKSHPHSPLTPEQQTTFTGLRYFPENPELRLALPLETFAEQDTIVMQTSTGVTSRIAEISFEKMSRAILPWLVPLLIVLAMITIWPPLTLWLPHLLMGR